MYKIELTKQARKVYLKLPERIRKAVHNKLHTLAQAPFASYNDVKFLRGTEDCYRLRVSDWRIIYRLHKNVLIIEVIKIAHRKEVYR